MSDVTAPPAAAPSPKRRPFEGWGSAAARGLSAFASALIRVTGKLFGDLRERGEEAYGDFAARPEHARWRAYALGSYGLVVVATLLAQLYSKNSLEAYVRMQPVELPALTQIFVRNDSQHAWHNVKLTLNGIYGYERDELKPGAFVLLPVNRFAIFDGSGKPSYAPKNIHPERLTVDCASGHYETDLIR